MSNFKATILETLNLPSRGIIYNNVPESFSMRPMTVNELKMLYGSSNTMNALNKILASVIDVEDFPVEDLITADKLYLAYQLRALTFTPLYKTKTFCEYCNDNVDVELDLLKDIQINYLPDNFENPRNIGKLPVSGDEIEIKLLTSKDFDKIINRSNEIRRKFPEYEGDPLYPITIGMQIASINGKKVPSRDIEEYVLDMHAMDDLYINNKIREVEVGPVIPVEMECPHCGNSVFVNIRLAEDFFRPELEF